MAEAKGKDPPTVSGRYNKWCEKKFPVTEDQNRINRALAFVTKRDLSPSERSALFLHELTDCSGLEFVAFSNCRLRKYVTLSGDVILVPCFLDSTEGVNIEDPMTRLTTRMEQKCRFVYDGWVPINPWDEANVRDAIRIVDEALSIFSIRAGTFFEWEPKYPLTDDVRITLNYEDRHLRSLENIAGKIDSFGEADRMAIYRSLGWLSQSMRLSEPTARFLFLILAIEALATYIENKAPSDSPLNSLRADKSSKSEKHKKTNECIQDSLRPWLSTDPQRAVREAYSRCLSIGRQLRAHFENLFSGETEPVSLLFERKVEGKSLYDLRHLIAHGGLDALSEVERNQIHQRVPEAEHVAHKYITTVLEKALGAELPSPSATANLPIQFLVGQGGVRYTGPTHMAEIYS